MARDVKSLISQMTLEEKAGLCSGASFDTGLMTRLGEILGQAFCHNASLFRILGFLRFHCTFQSVDTKEQICYHGINHKLMPW